MATPMLRYTYLTTSAGCGYQKPRRDFHAQFQLDLIEVRNG